MRISFNERPEAIKGEYGEYVVGKILNPDYQVNQVMSFGASHTYDFNLDDRKTNEQSRADVKAKACFHETLETGIDMPDYVKYLELSKKAPFYLYFIDPILGEIWGGEINDLYPNGEGRLVSCYDGQDVFLYNPEHTTRHFELDKDTIDKLRAIKPIPKSYITQYTMLTERVDVLLKNRKHVNAGWQPKTSYMYNTLKNMPSINDACKEQVNEIKQKATAQALKKAGITIPVRNKQSIIEFQGKQSGIELFRKTFQECLKEKQSVIYNKEGK